MTSYSRICGEIRQVTPAGSQIGVLATADSCLQTMLLRDSLHALKAALSQLNGQRCDTAVSTAHHQALHLFERLEDAAQQIGIMNVSSQ